MLLHKRVGEMSEKKKVKNAEYDVVVIGGGMSGICAALPADKTTGPEQQLVHRPTLFVGAIAPSEIRMHIVADLRRRIVRRKVRYSLGRRRRVTP